MFTADEGQTDDRAAGNEGVEADHARPRAGGQALTLLATPLVGLREGAGGSCRLVVDPEPDHSRDRVAVAVEEGRVVACGGELDQAPSAVASGSAGRWFSAVKDGTANLLDFDGARQLSEGLVSGLHASLLAGR